MYVARLINLLRMIYMFECLSLKTVVASVETAMSKRNNVIIITVRDSFGFDLCQLRSRSDRILYYVGFVTIDFRFCISVRIRF